MYRIFAPYEHKIRVALNTECLHANSIVIKCLYTSQVEKFLAFHMNLPLLH